MIEALKKRWWFLWRVQCITYLRIILTCFMLRWELLNWNDSISCQLNIKVSCLVVIELLFSVTVEVNERTMLMRRTGNWYDLISCWVSPTTKMELRAVDCRTLTISVGYGWNCWKELCWIVGWENAIVETEVSNFC